MEFDFTSRFNKKRNTAKNIQMLSGILQGIIADNELNDAEIHYLYNWFCDFNYNTVLQSDNEYYDKNTHFGHFENAIANKVSDVLEDGIVTLEEKQSLLDLIQNYLGGSSEDGVIGSKVINLPIDENVSLTKKDIFCFTGTLLDGTRKEWILRLNDIGVETTKSVLVSTTVLVVGVEPSRDWINTSYGRKIESVMAMKEKGKDIKIINQEMLVEFIKEHQ